MVLKPPPLPFPFPLQIGTDICHLPRVSRILTGQHGGRFLQKVLNEEERSETKWQALWKGANGRDDGGIDIPKEVKRTSPSRIEDDGSTQTDRTIKRDKWMASKIVSMEHSKKLEDVVRFLAGRWAAKEATIKAHPHFALSMQEITVLPTRHGPLAASIRRKHWTLEQAREVRVSVSHDGEYATAVCLAAEGSAFGKAEDQEARTSSAPSEVEHDVYEKTEMDMIRPYMNKHGIALHIGNLAPETTEQQLFDAFAAFPHRVRAYLPKGQEGKKSKYGFVLLKHKRGAEKALDEQILVKGRVVKVSVAMQDVGRKDVQNPMPGKKARKIERTDSEIDKVSNGKSWEEMGSWEKLIVGVEKNVENEYFTNAEDLLEMEEGEKDDDIVEHKR